jgi:hypothetical protein
MTALLEIQEKLLDTSATLSRLERLLVSHPHSEAVLGNLRAIQNKQRILEDAFLEEANKVEVDVCTYRLIPDNNRANISSLARILDGFQSAFSLAYEALKEGPKKKSTLNQESREHTSLGFAYSFSGSVGIVMTLPNERLLLGETYVDEAMRLVLQMAQSTTSQEIAGFAKKLGAPPVRALYKWAAEHTHSKFSADIEWRRKEQIRSHLFIQQPQLEQLRKAIEQTSEEKEVVEEVSGDLVGADVTRKSFHLKTPGRGEIRGTFADAISTEQTVELPKSYVATIRKRTRIVYSTEQEQESYFLLRLKART